MGDVEPMTSAELHSLARAIALDQAYAGGGVTLTTVVNDIIYWADRLQEDPSDESNRAGLRAAIEGAKKLARDTPDAVAFWFDAHAEREVKRSFADRHPSANGAAARRSSRSKKQSVQSGG